MFLLQPRPLCQSAALQSRLDPDKYVYNKLNHLVSSIGIVRSLDSILCVLSIDIAAVAVFAIVTIQISPIITYFYTELAVHTHLCNRHVQ